MGTAMKLQEKVTLPRTAWRLADVFILGLLLALLSHRVASLGDQGGAGGTWLAALVCEGWFTLVWILNMNMKWNPVRLHTYPENLSQRMDELPAVDMLVTTADPELEPPLITVNTVLSLLAVDYPDVGKLACYVSDDGCSPVTCYALREAAGFARLWVPFCKRHGVGVRAPFMYFASTPEPVVGTAGDWTFIKSEYDKLVSRIQSADEGSLLRHDDAGEFAEFVGAGRGEHPAIIKVLWDNSKSSGRGQGFPNLVYVSREKSSKQDHHYKAGALNVLARVSAVMTNAPIILNVDCDMFVNNPQVVLHAMCLLLGFDDETCSGFVQVPQRFYGKLKDDPFGNQLDVLREILFSGLAGLQGIFYVGTGCFHRRKVIYGEAPASVEVVKHEREGSASYEDLRTKFGDSIQLVESARNIFSGDIPTTQPMIDISSRAQEAREVATCNYEIGTHWGQEIGWSYGSVAEDILTGQRIHSAGWKSTTLDTNPPAFLGCAPTGGPASLTQYKRWATGLLEILLGQNSPILATIFRRLQFRQCLAYLVFYVWSVKAPFELCYALLGPYCLLTNHSFLYKASNHGFIIQLALFLTYNIYNYVEYMECGLSARACWNNQRMQRIISASSFILAFLSVPLKTIGLSKTVFEVTRKDKSKLDDDCATQEADLGRFTFDSSPVFIPVTALAILNIVAISIGAWRHAIVWRATGNHDCPNIAEFMCCGWLVLYFWPLTRGLVGRGRYGIPWSVKLKACVIVVTFLHLCGRN